MLVTIAAVGKLKKGPERELVNRYCDRIAKNGRSIGISALKNIEINESRATRSQLRKLEEAQSLQEKLPNNCTTVVFDERGKNPGSREFAEIINYNLNSGSQSIAFIIGGPDGLDPEFRQKASKVVSFGSLTIPHQIVRILVAEQIYRATTILSNHPYHRD